MHGKKIVKKLRFLKSGGNVSKVDTASKVPYENRFNFDTLMSGASNLFVNFNNENTNNRKVSISNPFDFINNVSGADSFYTPFYQTNIDKEIEKRLNNTEQESEVEIKIPYIETKTKDDKKIEDRATKIKLKYKEFEGRQTKKVFDDAMDRVAKYDKRLTPEVRKFLTEIAARESQFKINASAVTKAHTGYFQMSNSNIKAFANNVDKEQYIRDPELQITTALNLMDEITRLIPNKTLEKAKEKGYNKFGLIAGAWAGGNKGVDAFILRDEDRSDTHHYRKAGDMKAKGVSVGQYIDTFSKLFS